MTAEPEDVKPKLSLTIIFNEASCQIKVKPTHKFGKIFHAAEQRFGKEAGTLKFTYDGERIQAEDTPADLKMSDGDQIDAHLEQVGGWY